MKEFSQETIEIGGVEYTLFLNRAGIVAWERYAKKENQKVYESQELYNKFNNESELEITNETNPLEDAEKFIEDEKYTIETYKKMFWILLYTFHKLPLSKAGELFDEACKDYGRENILALEDQMVNDANKDRVTKENLKNLPALRPTK